MLNENAANELLEYRAGLRNFQDKVAGTYSKIAEPSYAQVGAWLSELLSLSILDADRQLATRPGHTGDLALLRHGIRLANALLHTFSQKDDPGAEHIKSLMIKTVNAIGTNLQTSSFVIEHALTPASATTVN